MPFYVLDENHNLIEAYSKEEVLGVLNQAIADGSLNNLTADSAFISKIKCCVGGDAHNVAFVTSAKYNELKAAGTLKANTAYFIVDDTTLDNVDDQFEEINQTITEITSGKVSVPLANNLTTVSVFSGSLKIPNSSEDDSVRLKDFVLENGYRYAIKVKYSSYETVCFAVASNDTLNGIATLASSWTSSSRRGDCCFCCFTLKTADGQTGLMGAGVIAPSYTFESVSSQSFEVNGYTPMIEITEIVRLEKVF